MRVTGLRTETRGARRSWQPSRRNGQAVRRKQARLHEATRHPVAKAASDPAHLAATTTADRPGATPRGAAPAWARRMPAEDLQPVVEVRTAAVAKRRRAPIIEVLIALLSLHEYEMERFKCRESS